MKYEVQLPPMPKNKMAFETNGPGGTGLLGCVLEHDGEYIQCVCDNWPVPRFSFTRGFAGLPAKDHPAAIWKVVNAPMDSAVRGGLFGDDTLQLPLVES